MGTYTENQKQSIEELDPCIHRAMSKVNARKETDLCRFIPTAKGHLHHFAFAKLKKAQPAELQKLISEHILEKENPVQVSSKPLAALAVKRTVEIQFKRSQINRLVDLLKNSGDEELISMLSPHQTLGQVQKAMLEMIKARKVDQGLWTTYMKLVEEDQASG